MWLLLERTLSVLVFLFQLLAALTALFLSLAQVTVVFVLELFRSKTQISHSGLISPWIEVYYCLTKQCVHWSLFASSHWRTWPNSEATIFQREGWHKLLITFCTFVSLFVKERKMKKITLNRCNNDNKKNLCIKSAQVVYTYLRSQSTNVPRDIGDTHLWKVYLGIPEWRDKAADMLHYSQRPFILHKKIRYR